MKLVILIAIGALAWASPAFADQTYTDTAGENAASADISTITIANDGGAAHTVTLKLQVANMPTITEANAEIDLLFDSDHNPATGTPSSGFDFLFFLNNGGYGFDKWDGTQFAAAPGDLSVTYTNGLMTVVFHESDFGTLAPTFEFAALSVRGPDPNNPAVDVAPDAGPLYSYTLLRPTVTPTVAATSVRTSGTAKSGTRFRVGPFVVKLTDGTSVSATSTRCTAKLGSIALKGSGAGGCTFALPKKAKGKKLVVTVSGTYGVARISKTTTFTVR